MLVAAGCPDDLPDPLACPPEAEVPAQDCAAPLQSVTTPGCLSLEQSACLTGPRSTCTCLSSECPEQADSCFPPGDCPAEVRSAAGEEAGCIRLSPEDFGLGLPSEYQCLCGCFGCAAVCDGAGPVFGVYTDGELSYGFPQISIGRHMPSSGQLGIYIRLRGIAASNLGVRTGPKESVQFVAAYPLVTSLETGFTELVLFKGGLLNASSYSWAEESEKPTLITFVPSGTPERPFVTLLEIDCVIPFLVPVR